MRRLPLLIHVTADYRRIIVSLIYGETEKILVIQEKRIVGWYLEMYILSSRTANKLLNHPSFPRISILQVYHLSIFLNFTKQPTSRIFNLNLYKTERLIHRNIQRSAWLFQEIARSRQIWIIPRTTPCSLSRIPNSSKPSEVLRGKRLTKKIHKKKITHSSGEESRTEIRLSPREEIETKP